MSIINNKLCSKEKFEKLVEDISEAIKKQNLVIFIGAGVSISQGFPNWSGYVDHLIKYWQGQLLSLSNSGQLAREQILAFDAISKSNLSNKRKIDLVNYSIKNILGDDSYHERQLEFEKIYFQKLRPFQPINDVLEELFSIDAYFITSNYDFEIENHAKRLRNGVRTIHDIQEFVDKGSKLDWGDVLHIHGTPDGDPRFFVRSSADYSKIYLREPKNFQQLQRWFKEKKPTVLFIGASLEEDEILSLLYASSKNYALLKADEFFDEKIDSEYRKIFETFFENENYTNIIWYGNEFANLPKFVKCLTSEVNDRLGTSLANREWNLLLNPKTSDKEYIEALNNNTPNFSFLSDLYKKATELNNDSLTEKLRDNTFKSSIIGNEVIRSLRSFWYFINKNINSLDDGQWQSIKKLLINEKLSFDLDPLYEIYSFATENSKFNKDELSKVRDNISKFWHLESTRFVEDRYLMGYWFLNKFKRSEESGDSHLGLYSPNVFINFDKIDFDICITEQQLKDLSETAELKQERIYESIKILFSDSSHVKLFYLLLKNRKIFVNEKLLIENIPTYFMKSLLVQKLLVLIDNEEGLSDKVVSKLINNIDFGNELFGNELNLFTENHKKEINSKGKTILSNGYHDAIGDGQTFFLLDSSFVTAKQIMALEEDKLIELLLQDDENAFNFDSQMRVKSAEGTEKYFIEILTSNNSQLIEKLQDLLRGHFIELKDRYFSLFSKICINKEISKKFKNDIRKLYFENMDKNSFSYNKKDVIDYFIDNEIMTDEVVSLFKSIDVKNLEYVATDEVSFENWINCDLGMYFDSFIKLINKHKDTLQLLMSKVELTPNNEYKKFLQGILLPEIHYEVGEISYSTFIGYIYYHRGVSENARMKFKTLVESLLQTEIKNNRVLNYASYIALNDISPEDIPLTLNNYSYLIQIIFYNEDNFNFEKKWVELLLEFKSKTDILFQFAYLITKDSVHINKLKNYINNYFEMWLNNSELEVELHLITTFLDKGLDQDRRELLVQYIMILFSKNRFKKSWQDFRDIETILPMLSSQQRQELLINECVQELLSPLEREELKKKVNSLNSVRSDI